MPSTSSYYVKYKVNNTTSGTSMHLYGPNESEAIAKLRAQGSVPAGATVIILSITPA